MDSQFLQELQASENAAQQRFDEAKRDYSDYIEKNADDILDSFRSTNKHFMGYPGKDIPSEQRHFCFGDKFHLDLYLRLVIKLGVFPAEEDAFNDLSALTPEEQNIVETTPSDKVALKKYFHVIEGEGFTNFAIILAKHLDRNGTYAISIEPTILAEWPNSNGHGE